MKNFSLCFILSFICAVSWAAEPECQINFSKLVETTFSAIGEKQISTGSKVRIAHQDRSSSYAFFLGQQGERLFFYDIKNEKILYIEKANAKISIQQSSADSNQQFRSIIQFETQEGPTCAVNAVVNCIKTLGDLSALHDAHLKTLSDKNPEALLKMATDLMGPEAVRAMKRQSVNSSNGWGKLINKIRSEGAYQTALREGVLHGYGISFKNNPTKSEIIDHLEHGYPLIIDAPVKLSDLHLENAAAKSSRTYDGLQPAKDSASIGSHSVVAVGIIRRLFGSDKVLVLDSANGQMNLWDLNKIRRYGSTILIKPDFSNIGD